MPWLTPPLIAIWLDQTLHILCIAVWVALAPTIF